MTAPVLTVTLNPAVDLYTSTARVEPTHKLRCAPPVTHPGGGGLNVARALHRLGIDVEALYLAGGAAGDELDTMLRAEGVAARRLAIQGATRRSFTVRSDAQGDEYRFVLPGPDVTSAELDALFDTLTHAPLPRYVVASGSLPPGAPSDTYARLARAVSAAGSRFVVDASGEALRQALAAGVFLAKPSRRELADWAGAPLATLDEQLSACHRLVQAGHAQWVALSLGADGALLVCADGAWRAPAIDVPVRSTVGAGDSFLAGLLAGWVDGDAPPVALRRAVAAAAAALLQPGTALCSLHDAQALAPRVLVSQVGH